MINDYWLPAFKEYFGEVYLDTETTSGVSPATGELSDNLRMCITDAGKIRISIS